MGLMQNDIELIEKYILGEVSEEQSVEFAQKLESSDEFKDEYLLQTEYVKYVEASEKAKLKNELKELFSKTEKVEAKVVRLNTQWYWIAASVVIFALSYFIIRGQLGVDFEEVYEENYTPFYGGPILRGAESDYNNVLVKYNNKQYQVALEGFKELKKNDPRENIDLLIANCYINLDRQEEAKDLLTTTAQQSKSVDHIAHAKWYLALLSLREGNIENCKKLVQEVQNNELYIGPAQNLLDDLR